MRVFTLQWGRCQCDEDVFSYNFDISAYFHCNDESCKHYSDMKIRTLRWRFESPQVLHWTAQHSTASADLLYSSFTQLCKRFVMKWNELLAIILPIRQILSILPVWNITVFDVSSQQHGKSAKGKSYYAPASLYGSLRYYSGSINFALIRPFPMQWVAHWLLCVCNFAAVKLHHLYLCGCSSSLGDLGGNHHWHRWWIFWHRVQLFRGLPLCDFHAHSKFPTSVEKCDEFHVTNRWVVELCLDETSSSLMRVAASILCGTAASIVVVTCSGGNWSYHGLQILVPWNGRHPY